MTTQSVRPPALVGALSRLNGALLFLCRWIAISLVAIIAVIVTASVVMRYGFNYSLSWAEDAAKFLMVWLTFIGAPLGFRHGAHVSLDLMVMLARFSWAFAVNGWNQVALTIGDLSMFWIFVSMPVGCALMASVAFELMIRSVFGVPEPIIAEEDVISTQGM